ncbi:MAG: glycoside hydrolase family 31 protein [Lachnospiraceae bacterium]|nr:glycoside hydrolase family 31 protein [Lachnospiraceae bacterium]
MIKKFTFGTPFQTDAVVTQIPSTSEAFPYFQIHQENGFSLTYSMSGDDVVYGLGENMRGINKRGYRYISCCSDDAHHTEDKSSLYAAHNFIMISGDNCFGLFIDCPEKLTFDIGYTDYDTIVISTDSVDMDLYLIEESSLKEIVHSFREMIGESYIPPKWGLGYQQSRWGYLCEEDFNEVANQYESLDIPLESIYMDIDYMERYKDFTIDEKRFPHFETLVKDLKAKGIKLVPIIDAGVKVEDGYDVYEEGIQKGYFCKDKDGKPFVAAVWPGHSHFPDVLNPEVRAWFGSKYQCLIDKGIEGFWNDMNEPAIFYSEEGLKECFAYLDSIRDKNIGIEENEGLMNAVMGLANNPKDYDRFYHDIDGKPVVHTKLHNLFGYNMTRAAADGFDKVDETKRFLLFSRSSYIGMHRYGGIWTGDNCAWWSHLLLNIKMMPSLNMCGFLYTGADLGGFGADTSYDLMVRWLQFGIFTPLMRNHAAKDTREQELYQFKNTSYFRELLRFRYSFLPYLYSEYVKASKNSTMLFSPLGFDYPEDPVAVHTEDQLLLGENLMIAPVYTQNAIGRTVYLPEDMLCITFSAGEKRKMEVLKKGHHYLELSLEEFPIFLRKNSFLVLCQPSNNTESLNMNALEVIGCSDGSTMTYEYYNDDGYTKDISLDNASLITVSKETGEWVATSADDALSFYEITIMEC